MIKLIGVSGRIGSGKDEVGKIILDLTKEEIMSVDVFYTLIPGGKSFRCKWEVKKYADKLKDIVCLILGCSRRQLEDHDFKNKELGVEWDYVMGEQDMGGHQDTYSAYDKMGQSIMNDYGTEALNKRTPREILQIIGSEGGRGLIHPDIWVNSLMSSYGKTMNFPIGFSEEEFRDDFWVITDVRFENEANAIKERGGINIRVNRPKPKVDEKGFAIHYYGREHISETALDDYKFDFNIDNSGSLDDLRNTVRAILGSAGII